jgi:protein-tyrosine phosphatase
MSLMTDTDLYRICFVCSGNICRSPMGEAVLRSLVTEAGLDGQIVVDSAGTGDWHVGDQADPRTMTTLDQAGYTGFDHRARQFSPDWFADRDLVLALDRGHLRTLRSWAPTAADRAKIRLLRSFDPTVGDPEEDGPGSDRLDVPDPYHGGRDDFEDVLEMIERACRRVLAHARARLAEGVAKEF